LLLAEAAAAVELCVRGRKNPVPDFAGAISGGLQTITRARNAKQQQAAVRCLLEHANRL
jgi:hypothetical protein